MIFQPPLHSIIVQSNLNRLRTKALGKLPYSLNRYGVVDVAGATLRAAGIRTYFEPVLSDNASTNL